MSFERPLTGLLQEFVRSVWAGRSDIRVIHSEAEWPPNLWLVLAEQVPPNSPAIAVQDGELVVGYRFVPLRIDSAEWWIVEATSYGRFACAYARYDRGWKLEDYTGADRTPLSTLERARFRSRGYRFADE
jgi:hypothetical protein